MALQAVHANNPAKWAAAFQRAADNAIDIFAVYGLASTFAVTSATDPGTVYIVTPDSCQCKGHMAGLPCMHVAAVRAALGMLDTPVAAPAPVAKAQAAKAPAVCGACHGKGKVLVGDEYHWPDEINCPRCQGSGIAPANPKAAAEPVALAAD